TLAEHPLFGVPALEFRGTPVGIDATLVARTQILPQINTGMAGRGAGAGQGGAGLVTPPAAGVKLALRELAALCVGGTPTAENEMGGTSIHGGPGRFGSADR